MRLEEPIKLRGHHIATLAEYYWKGILLKPSQFPNRNFLNLEIDYKQGESESSIFRRNYNKEQKSRAKFFFSLLL